MLLATLIEFSNNLEKFKHDLENITNIKDSKQLKNQLKKIKININKQLKAIKKADLYANNTINKQI